MDTKFRMFCGQCKSEEKVFDNCIDDGGCQEPLDQNIPRCVGEVQEETCSQKGGVICEGFEGLSCSTSLRIAQDTNSCCIGTCSETEDGNGEDRVGATQIGIKQEDIGTATDPQLKLSACNLNSECIQGECIDVAGGDLQSVFGVPTSFSDYLLKRFGTPLLDKVKDVVIGEDKEGLCVIDFKPLAKQEDIETPNQCTKGYSVENDIPFVSGTTEFLINLVLPKGERCANSFTKKEFKKLSDSELASSACDIDNNCNPKSGYTVDCVSQTTVGVEIPSTLGNELEIAFGGERPGICLAEPIPEDGDGTDILSFLSEDAFKIGDTGIPWFAVIGVVLVFLVALGGRRR